MFERIDFMENDSNVVTCIYCDFFEQFEIKSNIDFFEQLKGKCQKHNKICSTEDKICDYFKIKSGLYTKKEYPNKENRKPIPFTFYFR